MHRRGRSVNTLQAGIKGGEAPPDSPRGARARRAVTAGPARTLGAPVPRGLGWSLVGASSLSESSFLCVELRRSCPWSLLGTGGPRDVGVCPGGRAVCRTGQRPWKGGTCLRDNGSLQVQTGESATGSVGSSLSWEPSDVHEMVSVSNREMTKGLNRSQSSSAVSIIST